MHIIVDTREKKDIFLFNSYEDVETVSKKLDTGDYSIQGFENKITIDRKRTTAELHICLFGQYERFEKELERMGEFDEAYILCSFPFEYVNIFPEKSTVPSRVMKRLRGGNHLRKKFDEVSRAYPYVTFVFSDNKYDAEYKTYNILRRYYDANTK